LSFLLLKAMRRVRLTNFLRGAICEALFRDRQSTD
jgi:hypothetical protein